MPYRFIAPITVIALLLLAYPVVAAPLSTEGPAFRDNEGRQVLLHGVNIISKNRGDGYLGRFQEADYAILKQWGMNCVRLGIIWDRMEPEPGKRSTEYLDDLEKRLDWAAAHDIYVFLDMHQDLYSLLYADGAPEWATLHENKPHITGPVWSDAYGFSQAVQTAFDNFWANTPASDGVGIQDHYAQTWRFVAERFANHPAVIGYDLMNEPAMGSPALKLTAALLQSEFAARMLEKLGMKDTPPEDLLTLWGDDEGRMQMVQALADPAIYTLFVAAQAEINGKFEREKLQPMYQRVTNAIREVDPDGILLLETSYHCNAGITSAINAVQTPTGARDQHQAFTPHVYDIVVDTPAYTQSSPDRVNIIFGAHSEAAARLEMPLLIGEWGGFGHNGPAILPAARHVAAHFERLLASDTYWSYGRNLDKRAYFSALCRPIPQRVAGTLLRYKSIPATNAFTCTWQEDPKLTAPSRIYLPSVYAKGKITLTPDNTTHTVETLENAVVLVIPPTGDNISRTLRVAAAK